MRISDWSSDVCSSDLRRSGLRLWRGSRQPWRHSPVRRARGPARRKASPMMEILQVAVADVFTPLKIAFLLSGVAAGIVLGAIPGLPATMGITLVLHFTLTLDPSAAVLLMLTHGHAAWRERGCQSVSIKV